MSIPSHHKELAKHLRDRFREPCTISAYRDNLGHRPIDVGAFGPGKNRFYSTLGICDSKLKLPPGRFELAATGRFPWLPNALASSFYWLRDRMISEWPMVCEDVVKDNTKSRYRHMAYVPSAYSYAVSVGEPVRWLLGIPIIESKLTLEMPEMTKSVSDSYPAWMMGNHAQPDAGGNAATPRASA